MSKRDDRETTLQFLSLFDGDHAAKFLDRERQAQIDVFERLQASVKPEAWDNYRTKFQKVLFIDAKTWNPVKLFDTPPLKGTPGERMKNIEREKGVIKREEFCYSNQLLPKTVPLVIVQGNARGIVYFSDDVVNPTLFKLKQFDTRPEVLMSFTPMEVFTQRRGIRMAKGRVVVGGLGLGWLLNEICLRKSVTEVVLVEKNATIFYWLKPVLEIKYPALAKVKWICDDVYKFMADDEANHATTTYIIDIWPGFYDARYDPELAKWEKKLPRVWGWGNVSERD